MTGEQVQEMARRRLAYYAAKWLAKCVALPEGHRNHLSADDAEAIRALCRDHQHAADMRQEAAVAIWSDLAGKERYDMGRACASAIRAIHAYAKSEIAQQANRSDQRVEDVVVGDERADHTMIHEDAARLGRSVLVEGMSADSARNAMGWSDEYFQAVADELVRAVTEGVGSENVCRIFGWPIHRYEQMEKRVFELLG